MTAPTRVPIAHLPTPLNFAPRLSDELGIPIWLKRDDLTGLGLGGNKARSMEFHLGAAQAADADVFVTGGGPRSNWVLTAASGASARGLECELVLFGSAASAGPGNLDFLDMLGNVRVHFTGSSDRTSVDSRLRELEDRLASEGRRPYAVGRGGAGPVGAIGYYHAVAEIEAQMSEAGTSPGSIWLAAGSCGTMGGLVAGYSARGGGPLVVGAAVHRPVDECRTLVEQIAAGCLDLIRVVDRVPVTWRIDDQLDPDPLAVDNAARLMARTEGIFLDPEYGACALASLIAGSAETPPPAVLLLTGGLLNLFCGSSSA